MSTARSCDSAPSEPSLSPVPTAQADKTQLQEVRKEVAQMFVAQQAVDEQQRGAVLNVAKQLSEIEAEMRTREVNETARDAQRKLDEEERKEREELQRKNEDKRAQIELKYVLAPYPPPHPRLASVPWPASGLPEPTSEARPFAASAGVGRTSRRICRRRRSGSRSRSRT